MSTTLRSATDADVPALRRLVNAAYRELADRGLNFTGTYQDEATTRERLRDAEVFLLCDGDELRASICLRVLPADGERLCLYINQLAVHPEHKRRGLGTQLLDLAEARATERGLDTLRLDTAIPAAHLVSLYAARGYVVVDEVQWEGKTYRSYVMEKRL
jgi:ribosomal protein S18 acetylase RimI-like enzyme